MATKDYYQILETSRNASANELRSSYRKLALKYHPDRNPGNPQAEEHFKEINAAYQILSDPTRRAYYDSGMPNPTTPQSAQNRPTTPEPAQNRPPASNPTPSRPIPPKAYTSYEIERPPRMTGAQIGLLGGVGLFGVLMIGAVFMLIFSPKAKPVVIAAPRATHVVAVANTATPTPRPIISTLSPPNDWIEFETEHATLWLPNYFVGGDMLAGKQESIYKVNELGPYFKYMATSMKNPNKDAVLWMVDKTLKQTDFFTFIVVFHLTASKDTDLDEYIHKALNDDSNGTPVVVQITIHETKKLTVLGHEARRLTFSTMYAGHDLVSIFYFIKDGADIWELNYYVTPQEYIDTLPIIEKSVKTFNIIP